MQIFTHLKAGIHSCFYIAPCYPEVIRLEDELRGVSTVFRSVCRISRQKSLLYILPCKLMVGNKIFCSVVVVENGRLIGTSDMTHGSGEDFHLSSVFCVHNTRYGKIGILIDTDVEYFEVGRMLTLMGAEILLFLGGARRMAYAQSVSNGVIGIYSHGGKVIAYNALYRKLDDGIRITSLYPITPRPRYRRPQLYELISSSDEYLATDSSVYSPKQFIK